MKLTFAATPLRNSAAAPDHAAATDPSHRSTDEELALHAQRGSLSSFGELVERYELRLIGFLRRRCNFGASGAAGAEDLAQETFLRAWERLHTYRPGRTFSTWLFTIASRLAIDHWRRHKGEAQVHAQHAPRIDSSTQAQLHEDPSDIWAVAQRILDPESASALWLRYGLDLDAGAIATILGRTRIGVRVMLHRSREKLQHALQSSSSTLDPNDRPVNNPTLHERSS